MSGVEHEQEREWWNYHRTRHFIVADSYRFVGDTAPHPDGPTRFASTCRTIFGHLATLGGPANVGMIGSAWSLSELVGCEARQLDTAELEGVSWVETPHLHHQSRLSPREAVFVGGGTSWKALVEHVECDGQSPRSIFTCGSYLAQSIAGSVASSTGGSRLGYGGVQDQVIGLHLITGSEESVWLERRSDPVLGHVAATFADRVIRDDAIFEDALVHLGGMGLVNGLVIETAELEYYTILKTRKPVDVTWLAWVRDGNFDAVAQWLGISDRPVYYEVQIDPFDWDASPAIHTMFFPARNASAPLLPTPNIPVAELLGTLAGQLARRARAREAVPEPSAIIDCNDVGQALADLFRFYAECRVRLTNPGESGGQTWGQIHSLDPAPEEKALIYSAAFAFPREDFARALPAVCAAVRGRPRRFLYTLRFVSEARGSMAFAHFPESVVLDFEGLKITPDVEKDSRFSLDLAREALREAGIRHAPHWGKLGEIDPGEVERVYGSSQDPASRLSRWRRSRDYLLGEEGRRLFWNDALARWGLV